MTTGFQTRRARIPNTKGIPISAEWQIPVGNAPCPAVVLIHGFTGYKESSDLIDLSGQLVRAGIMPVRFTATGFGDSGGTLANDYRFSAHRADTACVVRYVRNISGVDPDRIGLYGHSIGGKLAVLVAGEMRGIGALCAASAPVSFVGTMYEPLIQEWKRNGYFEKVSSRDGRILRIPYAYVSDEEDPGIDVLAVAAGLRGTHALVIAGTLDAEVPWGETRRIFDSLGCEKRWRLYDGLPHKYREVPDLMRTVHRDVAGFFAGHL